MSTDPETALGEVKTAGTVVTVVITLLTVGAQAAVLKALQVEMEVFQLFLRTAPLTLAVAVSWLIWARPWGHDEAPILRVLLTGGVMVGSLWLAGKIGGVRPEVAMPRSWVSLLSPGRMIEFLWRALSGYYRAYGAGNFWSSLILGGFLGWTWRKLLPHAVRQLTER